MLKAMGRVAAGAFIASAITGLLSALGFVLVPTWTGRAPAASMSLGANLGVFFVASAVGYAVLRAMLKSGGKLQQYMLGGALVGLAAGTLALLIGGSAATFLPYALGVSLLAGSLGAIVVSGSGVRRPVTLSPIGSSDTDRPDEAPVSGG